jgi:hypothetical protein
MNTLIDPAAVKFRPIIFTHNIEKILDGSKTQTRRVITPLYGWEHYDICRPEMAHDPWAVWWHSKETEVVGYLQECPQGKPGDRLWVKESYRLRLGGHGGSGKYIYRADGDGGGLLWQNVLFMPREASRLTLEITNVKAERVQDISAEDARAEGAAPCDFRGTLNGEPATGVIFDPVYAFSMLWDSINLKRGQGWAKNPWCWCITFKRATVQQCG